jgi:hypothetical protein
MQRNIETFLTTPSDALQYSFIDVKRRWIIVGQMSFA